MSDYTEFDSFDEMEKEEIDFISFDISNYPADYTLQGYLDKYDAGSIVIPDFQRSYVWDQVKASKLIESFLLGLPVPGVFLYKERKTNKLLVIDGQQRILSVVKFIKNDFDGKSFLLKNINAKWNGKSFDDLSESDQLGLKDSIIRATVVQQLDPNDDSSIYHIFERLNTGGVNLNPMEIRKCIYFGEYFSHIQEMNKYPSWQKIIGKSDVDKRLRDAELVLRVVALANNGENYEKPMKRFLNNYIAASKNQSSDSLKKLIATEEKNFYSSCDRILNSLGEKPFNIRGRLNFAALDSVVSTLMNNQDISGAELKEGFFELLDNDEYIRCVTINTSDEITLKRRYEIARNILGN